MAITPTKPTQHDVGSNTHSVIWVITSMATSDTVVVPYVKQLYDVTVTNRPSTTFTYTSSTKTLSLVCTASSTGSLTAPTVLVVYGR